MKVGIVCDLWKAPIFRKGFTEANYEFEEEKDKKNKFVVFKIQTTNMINLQLLVRKINAECKAKGN